MIPVRVTLVAMTLAVAMSACSPGGVADSDSPTPSASPTPSVTSTQSPSPSPTAGDEGGWAGSSGVGTDTGDEGDAGAWVNGYIIQGSDDVHFGPEWGPTWYFDKTIGERFTGWYTGAATVDATCPWVAVLDSYPEFAVYSIALADPRGDTSTAIIFRMDNPGDPAAPRPMNGEGLSIGSSMDDVLAAYPGTTVQFFNDEAWGDVYEIDVFQPATDTHMFFWSWEPLGVVQDIQWGHFPSEASWRGHTCAG